MLCQFCLRSNATTSVTQRNASGDFVEVPYCQTCYEAKFVDRRPDDPGTPRPRFRLKHLMWVTLLFAVLNGVVAWGTRFDNTPGTAQQKLSRATDLFLFVNLMGVVLVTTFTIRVWLDRVAWYRRTGNLIPMLPAKMQVQAPITLNWKLIALAVEIGFPILIVYASLSVLIAIWLTRLFFPIQQLNAYILGMVMITPFVFWAVSTRIGRGAIGDIIEKDWKPASPLEWFIKVARCLIPLTFLSEMYSGVASSLFGPRPNGVTIVLMIALLSLPILMLEALASFTTRRR